MVTTTPASSERLLELGAAALTGEPDFRTLKARGMKVLLRGRLGKEGDMVNETVDSQAELDLLRRGRYDIQLFEMPGTAYRTNFNEILGVT